MTAYYDLWGALPPRPVPKQYRETPRYGDRALLYAYLARWRAVHPETRLVLIEERRGARAASFQRLARWLAKALSAEYRLVAEETLPSDLAQAEALTLNNLWNPWYELGRQGFCPPVPRIEGAAATRARAFLREHGLVRGGYVTVQPLIAAAYNLWRVREPAFWQERIAALARVYPTVVVGGPECAAVFGDAPAGATYAFHRKFDFLESLALVQNAHAHVGGETGLSLWAPIVGTDTIVLYDPAGHVYQPLAFGRRFSILPLDAEPEILLSILNGVGSETLPTKGSYGS